MKLAETKIYIKFISWFLANSFLPLIIFFSVIYFFPNNQKALLISIFGILALVLILALVATRHLSGLVTTPIQSTVQELSKVVDQLSHSVQNLSDISQNNENIAAALLLNNREQQSGLSAGSRSVVSMVTSLNQISQKTKTASQDTAKIDNLASMGKVRAKEAVDSLAAIRHLVTEHQKLSTALDSYALKVQNISERLEALSANANFISLNAALEANKSKVSEDFISLVVQTRELNAFSQRLAGSIRDLAQDMQSQIKMSKQSSLYEIQETAKSAKVVDQTIQFLSKILGGIGSIAKNIKIIHQEAAGIHQRSDKINTMIKGLNKEAKSLVASSDNINQSIIQQTVVVRALQKSSMSLARATALLNDLVGRYK